MCVGLIVTYAIVIGVHIILTVIGLRNAVILARSVVITDTIVIGIQIMAVFSGIVTNAILIGIGKILFALISGTSRK